jgi:hypothetical protein
MYGNAAREHLWKLQSAVLTSARFCNAAPKLVCLLYTSVGVGCAKSVITLFGMTASWGGGYLLILGAEHCFYLSNTTSERDIVAEQEAHMLRRRGIHRLPK